jgi:hypothetical protein
LEVEIRPVEPGDLDPVAANMRAEDVAEVWASGGYTPREALDHSVSLSGECHTVWMDRTPIALFGVATVGAGPGIGWPWFLGTPDVSRAKSHFLRQAPGYLAAWLAQWPVLMNYVDARNLISLRWLRRLGATIHPAVPYGQAELPFHPFEFRREPL